MSPVPCPILGIIVSQFPELHETFIARELAALKRAGIALRIYSLKRCRDRIVHPEATALLTQVASLAWDDARVWVVALQQCVRHPIRALTTLIWTLRHHHWPLPTLAKGLVIWGQAMALARRMSRDGVTHVHAHWATMPTSAAVLVSRWLGVPFSFTAHAWDIFVPNPSLLEKIRLASRVITCTDYNRRHLVELCPEAAGKIMLNYHGVDVEKFSNTAEGQGARDRGRGSASQPLPHAPCPTPLFLSVGRLVETKGYETLLEAYRILRAQGRVFRAVIVGEGPLRSALREQIRRSGLAGTVEVRSAMRQDELRALYASASAFVLPSVVAANGDRDGIPNVIFEAMAMGLPVVSTRVSGIPEAVQDRRTGLLVAPGDPAALAEALDQLIQRPAWGRELGEQGRAWVEAQFDDRVHLRQLAKGTKELLETSVSGCAGARVRGLTGSPAHRLTRPPVKVMYVIWSLGLGGAEQVVIRLASALDRSRFTPLIVCLNEPGPFASAAIERGIDVFALHKRGPFDVRVVATLAKLMREHRVDVVHTHLWGANLWGRLAACLCRVENFFRLDRHGRQARLAGVRTVIATEHNTDTWKRGYHFVLDRLLAPWTTTLVAVSKQVQAFYEQHGVGHGQWQVIYNGVDLSSVKSRGRRAVYQSLGILPTEPVIGLIGRLVPAKAPHVFLEAVARAVRQVPSLKALIIGDGPLRPALEAQAQQLGLAERVLFTGVRRDVPELLAGMDALVFSSEREGLSMAMLEAMAAGTPVIATRVGGTPELIEDRVSGLLAPQGQPEAIAERIVELVHDRWKAQAIRYAARERVEQRFSLHRMVSEYETLYVQGARGTGHGARENSSPPPPVSRPSPLQRPTKIAYVIDDLGIGGAQRQLKLLLESLDHSRFQATVVSLSTKKLALRDAIAALGVPVVAIRQYGPLDLRALWTLYRLLRRERFTIVQTCLFTADLYGRVAASLAGVPIRISSVRSVETDKPRRYVWADRLLAPATRQFIVNADCVGEVLRAREGVPAQKIQRIYNGVILDGHGGRQADPGAFVIGSIGRLEPVKGYPTLLRAFAEAHRAQPNLRLLLVGDGSQRDLLERQALALKIDACVEFAGRQTHVAPWLARMDLFVLPSTYEGCSNAVLEAMAAGRPVIATAVGGNPELVQEGETGLLVPSGDAHHLADAMLQLARDPARAQAMAQAARARIAAHFSVVRMAQQTEQLYRELLAGVGQ